MVGMEYLDLPAARLINRALSAKRFDTQIRNRTLSAKRFDSQISN
jgi:hypothetical protein